MLKKGQKWGRLSTEPHRKPRGTTSDFWNLKDKKMKKANFIFRFSSKDNTLMYFYCIWRNPSFSQSYQGKILRTVLMTISLLQELCRRFKCSKLIEVTESFSHIQRNHRLSFPSNLKACKHILQTLNIYRYWKRTNVSTLSFDVIFFQTYCSTCHLLLNSVSNTDADSSQNILYWTLFHFCIVLCSFAL